MSSLCGAAMGAVARCPSALPISVFARLSAPSPIGGSPCGHCGCENRMRLDVPRHSAAHQLGAAHGHQPLHGSCDVPLPQMRVPHVLPQRWATKSNPGAERTPSVAGPGRATIPRERGVPRGIHWLPVAPTFAGGLGVKPRIQPHSCAPAAGGPSGVGASGNRRKREWALSGNRRKREWALSGNHRSGRGLWW
jgi:hypothetical protein